MKLTILILVIVLTSCNVKRSEVKYYQNGKLKSKKETINDVLDGSFEDRWPDGEIYRSGFATKGVIREITYY